MIGGRHEARHRLAAVNCRWTTITTGVRARDIAVLPRALTLVESNHPDHQPLAEELLTRLLPHTGQAIRVGITGAPGAGQEHVHRSPGHALVRAGRQCGRAGGRSVERHQRRQHPGRQDTDGAVVGRDRTPSFAPPPRRARWAAWRERRARACWSAKPPATTSC